MFGQERCVRFQIFVGIGLLVLSSTKLIAQPSFGQQWQKSPSPLFITIGPPGSWNGVPTDQINQLGHGIFDGSEYKLYFAGFDGQSFSIGMVTSTTLESGWQFNPNNPVLRPGPPGAWDEFHVGNPTVLFENGNYTMWYSAHDAQQVSRIGLATSADGVNWVKYENNPVFDVSANGWDSFQLHTPYVIKIEDTYHLWYAAHGQSTRYAIGYATSPDGINWTRMSNDPVLEVGAFGTWEGNNVHTPLVLFENNRFHIWYLGASNEFNLGGTVQTGFAVSDDGLNWTKDPNNPVLRNGGPGSLDFIVTAGLVLFKTDATTYKLVFAATDLATFFGTMLATLEVPTGEAPDIAVSDDTLNFGPVIVGASATRALTVSNRGTDDLIVSGLSSDNPLFGSEIIAFRLNFSESRETVVTFVPNAEGEFSGTLSITSNDPDEPTVTVALHGRGVRPSEIKVSPDSLTANLFSGETETLALTISNTGLSNLNFDIATAFANSSAVINSSPVFHSSNTAPAAKETLTATPIRVTSNKTYVQASASEQHATEVDRGLINQTETPLETILMNLNLNSQTITNAIPNRFDFFDGETDQYIFDGGADMYDGGNFLSTNLGGSIEYSNDVIINSTLTFGVAGRYFTRKYPGLFVLAADMQGVDSFEINGDLGADGEGSVDGAILETRLFGVRYRGFVKRVFDATDPSVNHLVIVAENPAAAHEFDTDTNFDFHQVFNLAGTTRMYYLLYAGSDGFYINNVATLNIMNLFLSSLGVGPSWIAASPHTGTVAANDSINIEVTFDARSLIAGNYGADILIASNDPDGLKVIPTRLHVNGAPDIAVSEDSLNFGSALVDTSFTRALIISNLGTDALTVRAISSDDAHFTLNLTSFSINPGENQEVLITFTPSALQIFTATLAIASNDPDEPVKNILLQGEGSVFGIDGNFSEPGYMLAATKLNNNQSFGPDVDVTNIYYGVDASSIYLGFECGVQNVPNSFNPKPDGVGVFLNFSSETGKAAGNSLGFDVPTDFHFLNGNYAENFEGLSDHRQNFKADFEVDYLFAFYSDGTSNVIIFDAATHATGKLDSIQHIGTSAQNGTVGSGPASNSVFSRGSIFFAFQRSSGRGSKKGMEIRIPFSELGGIPPEQFEIFATIVSSTAYFSTVTLPGNVTSGNSGFEPDYSSNLNSSTCNCPLPSGAIGTGPFHTLGIPLITGISAEPGENLPQDYALHQSYPNPFNPETSITFDLPKQSHVTLKVFDILGRNVRALVNETKPAGVHKIVWNGKNDRGESMNSGVYFYRLQSGSRVETKKMLLLR